MSKDFYEFFCPVKVIAGLLRHVEVALATSGVEIAAVFDDVPPDSSLTTVGDAAHLYRAKNCNAILAVGGGSVIDTSKGVNILVSEGGDDLTKYSGAHHLKRPLKPLFVVPTTAGTGSERTMVAVISDKDRSVKIPFTSYFLMPNAAVLDPRMTLTLPAHITEGDRDGRRSSASATCATSCSAS